MNDEKISNPISATAERSTQDLIAEAIRAKQNRNENVPVDSNTWEELESRMLADIEMFSQIDERTILSTDVPVTKRPHPLQSQQPPKLFTPGGVPRSAPSPQGAAPAAARMEVSPAVEPVDSSLGVIGLLGELSELSARHETEEYSRLLRHEEALMRMSEVMRHIFIYAHELVKQLNRLRVPIPRDYPVFGTTAFTNLAWREGFADYRTLMYEGKSHLNLISLSYQLASPEQFRVERDGAAADGFRRQLIDSNIHFSYEEIKNTRQRVEKAIFTFPAEVRVNIRFHADYEREVVTISTKNLERFGVVDYELPAASISRTNLDELGKIILARPSKWRAVAKK